MSSLYPIAALLFSVLLLVAGNSLISVVTPVRGSLEGFGDLELGLLGSAYFAGMLAGTLNTPAIVRQVGHIRAFAAFVATGAVAVDLMALSTAPAAWMVSRALIGFVFAGIYAVIESWINANADNTNRGSLYAVYQIVNFAATAMGQMLMRVSDPRAYTPFTLGAGLFALAIVPLALTRSDAPELPRSVRLRLSFLRSLDTLALAAASVAGAANGAAISLAPVYALQIGVKPASVPFFTASIVLGSALGVFPVGRISDRLDRRYVMAAIMALGALVVITLALLNPLGPGLTALGFLVGLTTYTLYTLAASTANDRVAPHDMVLVSSALLFVYCLGAIAAPPLASVMMRHFGAGALFWQNAACHAALAGFAIFRIAQSPARASSRRR